MKRSLFALLAVCFQYGLASLTAFIFDQKLDHFNASDSRTFPQRYWVVDDHWNQTDNAPVLLFLGRWKRNVMC